MKPHVLRYLIREGCRNTWHNRLMALASVGVLVCCLLLTVFSYLLYVNVDHMFQNAYEQNVVAVYLDADCSAERVEEIHLELDGMENVSSVEFISKDELLEDYGEELQANTLESFKGENNPLPDTFIVSMVDLNLADSTRTAIESIDGVEETTHDAGTAQTLTRLRRVVLVVGGSIIVVLLAVSLFIIVNTIKLTVYSRRLEIYIMKSVGATDGFVRFPFIVEGVLLGLISGALGYGLIALLYRALVSGFRFDNPMLSLVPFSDQWLPLLIGFLGGGVLVGVCGSVISMGKYLRQEGGYTV